MKRFTLSMLFVFSSLLIIGCHNVKAKPVSNSTVEEVETSVKNNDVSKDVRIQLAILLDTSSSMDGLIDQARARLWNVVNTLTTLKFKGKTPQIEIALYEYGNNSIPSSKKYIRRVVPFTCDLDLLSEHLFALRTNGGSEYCGAVIERAVNELDWGKGKSDMKLIYIAGNEPFTQGPVNYKKAISLAVDNNVYVNTIHCGDDYWGGRSTWKEGALLGEGKFFNIDHDAAIRYYSTPYDDAIDECNRKLNDTYISYSKSGVIQKQSQMKQDENAKSMSSANYAERVVSKSKGVYKNAKWDLVDVVAEDEQALEDISEAELSDELSGKTKAEIKQLATEKKVEREKLQKEIAVLAKQREVYIEEEKKKEGESVEDDLGFAISQSVLDLAQVKGYEVKK